MLLARGFSQTDFGNWLLYLSLFTLLEMIKSGGLQTALVMQLAGKSEAEKASVLLGAWKLAVLISVALGGVTALAWICRQETWNPGVIAFLQWYPLAGLITIPYTIGQAVLQSEHRFDRLLKIRLLQSLGLFVASGLVYVGHYSLSYMITAHVGIQGLCCVLLLSAGWVKVPEFHSLRTGDQALKELVGLGKFSFGTLAATHVLKSADTFLIGAMLGPGAVSIYAIPLRLTELLEIPLRSATATAFPRLSSLYNHGNSLELKHTFYQYAGLVTLLFVPVLLGCFLLADVLVVLVGGKSYESAAGVFRVFLLYGLLLPADRFTGVLLDALKKPSLNLVKVLMMAAANILGDLIALYFFKDLRIVALASVCNAAVGVGLGFWLVHKYLPLQLNEGWLVVKTALKNRHWRKEEVV